MPDIPVNSSPPVHSPQPDLPPAYGLTAAQRDCLLVIQEIQRETGICPSFAELQRELDVTSKAAIGRLVCSLEERGYIRRIAGRARALEVLRWIEPPCAAVALERAVHLESARGGGQGDGG